MIQISELLFERGRQVVLDHVSLAVRKSEVMSIMGPSGCGKTTILKCLSGLERPAAGSIEVSLGDNGAGAADITQLPEWELNEFRRHVGMVFQYAALFDSMSVFDNVSFPLHRFHPERSEREVEEEVAHLLSMVGLNPHSDAGKMPAELSGGMRKRVGLARAIALRPEIMLYDEPSSGLDPVSAANIDRLILEMRDRFGVTSVVVSHHVANILSTSDRVAMLYGGKVLALGTPDEIRASDDPRVRQFITGSADGPLTDIDS